MNAALDKGPSPARRWNIADIRLRPRAQCTYRTLRRVSELPQLGLIPMWILHRSPATLRGASKSVSGGLRRSRGERFAIEELGFGWSVYAPFKLLFTHDLAARFAYFPRAAQCRPNSRAVFEKFGVRETPAAHLRLA